MTRQSKKKSRILFLIFFMIIFMVELSKNFYFYLYCPFSFSYGMFVVFKCGVFFGILFVTLILPLLKSETCLTGDLLSNCVLLILKKTKRIAFFFKKKGTIPKKKNSNFFLLQFYQFYF